MTHSGSHYAVCRVRMGMVALVTSRDTQISRVQPFVRFARVWQTSPGHTYDASRSPTVQGFRAIPAAMAGVQPFSVRCDHVKL